MKFIKLAFSIVLVLSVLPNLASAEPDTLWTATFGGNFDDGGRCIRKTSDGGYIIAGYTSSAGAGKMDAWLVKIDSEGSELWNLTYGGSEDDKGYSIDETSDGGFIFAGSTTSYGAGSRDAWLVRIDSDGDELWSTTFGGSEQDYARSVQETSNGDIIFLGLSDSFGSGNRDFYLVRTDSSGVEIWSETFGGTENDKGYQVRETSDGGFILVGETESYGAGDYDLWLVKADSTGSMLWSKTFGGGSDDFGKNVRETADGGFILLGESSSYGAGDLDSWLIRTDSDGSELWNKTYGGEGDEKGYSVRETADGGFIHLGYSNDEVGEFFDFWTVRTDSDGGEIWSSSFGGNQFDGGRSVLEISDGGYMLLGETESMGAGGRDIWLIRLDQDVGVGGGNGVIPSQPGTVLLQNYPNPFNPATVVAYSLDSEMIISLKIYDLSGRLVRTLVNGVKPAGDHSVVWNGLNDSGIPVGSGVYLTRLHSESDLLSRKMILMK